jgi:Tfp pilus assembly protein PilO
VNTDRIIELINRFIIPVVFLLLAYVGYDTYTFFTDPAQPILTKQKEIDTANLNRTKLEKKLKEVNTFVESLEQKKVELRRLAQELQGMKETLSDRVDTANFMKMVLTESKKVGVTVLSLKPAGSVSKEYYTEQNFSFQYRGVFAQVVNFLERMTNVAEIVRVDNFNMKPVGVSKGKLVQLEGTLELKTFTYLGSKADTLGSADPKSDGANPKSPSPTKVGGGS